MWPKDDYQEHMLGYIDEVCIEFERLPHAHRQQHDLNDFYANLDSTLECLWQLMWASDGDWEDYRYPLETRCDELMRALGPLYNGNSLALSGISFHPIRALEILGTSVIQRKPENWLEVSRRRV
jgi:hypothetical protein